ncbi:MAG: hypothetical protein MH204_06800 [Fimbriimonadaceae bacterium]|nr:hypothetical protein [Fimbriimonadaceae bacterium]
MAAGLFLLGAAYVLSTTGYGADGGSLAILRLVQWTGAVLGSLGALATAFVRAGSRFLPAPRQSLEIHEDGFEIFVEEGGSRSWSDRELIDAQIGLHELSLSFRDGVILTVPAEAFGTRDVFERACRIVLSRLDDRLRSLDAAA